MPLTFLCLLTCIWALYLCLNGVSLLQKIALLKEFRKHEGSRNLNLAEFKKALSVRGEVFAEALFNKLDIGRIQPPESYPAD